MAQLIADNFSDGKTTLVFDIPESNTFGYAPDTKMRLSSKKLEELGWKASVNLEEMYRRMIPDLKGKTCV